ncbi:MAG: hypothetical protein GKR97_19705 [Rhizobiaceae bacterium]|nr:hypothetical protein [Rhizobiaceae bacterium]
METRRGLSGATAALVFPERISSIVGLLTVAVLYVWLISKFGYLISTATIAPMVMWMFGMRNPLALVATAILCPATYHYTFFVALGVFPPYGEWFDLLDIIQGN